jgi:predicted nucleic acid-binding Zn ribbon protein
MLDNGSSVPFYEYRRPDGTILEVMQKMTDPPLAEDPETGVPLQRIFHPIAVHFKGKGFYNTDYGTKKRARENAETKASEKKSEDKKSEDKKSDAAASESKAAKKPETAKADSKGSSSSSSSKESSKPKQS